MITTNPTFCFFYNDVYPIQDPRATRGRELQSKRHRLWGYVGKIVAGWVADAYFRICLTQQLSILSYLLKYSLNQPMSVNKGKRKIK